MPVVTGDIKQIAGTALTSGEVRFTATKPIVQNPNAKTTSLAASVAQHVVPLSGTGTISATLPATGEDWVYRVEIVAYVGSNRVSGTPTLLLEVTASGADLSQAGIEGATSGRVVVNRLAGTQEINQAVAPISAKADSALAVAASAEDTAERFGDDVDLLKQMAQIEPGSVTDAQTALLIQDPNSESHARLNAQIDSPRTYTTPQTFDPVDGAAPINLIPDAPMNWNTRTAALNIGPDLQLRRHQGNAGQRLALVGRDADTMPYFEVVAATRTGTDGGAAVAGYQLHLGPDDGAGNNREMFVIEAVGENHSDGPHFRIATHASGTGVRRPLLIKGGDTTAFQFDNSGRITARMPIEFRGDHSVLIDGYRNTGNQTVAQSIVYTNGSSVADVFLGMAGGTNDAPTPPIAGNVLGSYKIGSHNGTTRVDGAQIRALASESWTFGSAEGVRLEFLLKKNGSAANTIAARVSDPAWNQAGLSILANTEGGDTATLKQVFIGPADSAGTGYRALRITN